ncbi:hypothetical protein [Variovorax paradoxus]|uniref:hypothetical protein n=1 Tax=Variovorax paradoxus TaxID=34073 RepID=UPI001427C3B0|nr:hypothetical protein [Variovorax paradoxus]
MRLFIAGLEVIQLAGSLLHITVRGSVLFDIGGVLNAGRAAGAVRIPTTISLACPAVLFGASKVPGTF